MPPVITNPNVEAPYEDQRSRWLPAANILFTAAHMQGCLQDYLRTHPSAVITQDIESQAYATALATAAMYEKSYSSPDRHYHTLQHPRVQLLDADGLALLEHIPLNIESGSEAFHQQVLQTLRTLEKNTALAQTLRDNDRHDFLYYFKPNPDETDQYQLLKSYKESDPHITVGAMIAAAPVPPEAILFNAIIPPLDVPIGELAAVCMFPVLTSAKPPTLDIDRLGHYDASRTFEGFRPGLNEFASAVHAIVQESRHRGTDAPLSAREILDTCVTIAATIPYQRVRYLDEIATNLYHYLSQHPNLQKELGVQNDFELRELIDTSVSRACKFSEADVGNFYGRTVGGIGTNDPMVLRWGDDSVTAELQGMPYPARDPVHAFRLAFLAMEGHLNQEERKAFRDELLDEEGHPLPLGSGFIRAMADSQLIFHNFGAPLTGRDDLRVMEATQRHAQYYELLYYPPDIKDLSKAGYRVIPEHRRDMVCAALQIDAHLRGATNTIERDAISPQMIDAFFEDGNLSTARIIIELIGMPPAVKAANVNDLGDGAKRIIIEEMAFIKAKAISTNGIISGKTIDIPPGLNEKGRRLE